MWINTGYKKREWGKNTPLARRLAKLYEIAYDEPFPGGISNAAISRDQLAIRAYKDAGSWVWSLKSIDREHLFKVRDFGSNYAATKCLKDIRWIEAGWGNYPFMVEDNS